MSGTLYDTLEVPIGTKEISLKRAYRRLVFKHHPDTGDGNTEALQKIQEAYDLLRDPTKRAKYDIVLEVLESQKQVQDQEEERQRAPKYWQPGNIQWGSSGSSRMVYASGSVFFTGGYVNVSPKVIISIRVHDVAGMGLTGLSVGQTVFLTMTSGSAMFSRQPSISLTANANLNQVAGKIVRASYGIAPGMPAYGDFEIEY